MQKLFDKILTDRIKKVFNNHREAYKPADWEKLKERMNGTKRGLIIWMQIAKAASVVLFVGVSTFYANKNDKYLSSTYKKRTTQTEQGISTIEQFENKQISEKYEQENNIETGFFATENNAIANEDKANYQKNIFELRQTNYTENEETKTFANNNMDDSLKQLLQMQLDECDLGFLKKAQRSKFDFAVALASIYSYSDASTKGSINMGGGLSASYKLSKKLSISTGLLIAKQSLAYNRGNSNMVFANSADKYEASTNMLKDETKSNSQIEFIGLDIPLNLKYKIKNFIITTGISSLVYISQKKTYTDNKLVPNTTFNTLTNSYETVNTLKSIQLEEITPAFSSMDFASLLNISIGYQLPLNKGSIVFEPFIKYPLGKISSANLKIASGGISVQYYF